jgi:exodeoxyribonuclease V gamma subunit
MLHLFKARNHSTLAKLYIQIAPSLPTQLFTKQTLIVPNKMIGRWLQQKLAQADGISVNLDLVLPANYLWSLLRRAVQDLPERSDFSSEVMQLSIRKILGDSSFTNDFPRLGNYLKNCRDSDRMVLAGKISRIFDHYQVYRGDWLSAWEQGNLLNLGEDEAWQQALWCLLTEKSGEQYRSQLEQQLIAAIQNKAIILPKALCIFGVTSLPESFINLIKVLSKHCECYVFTFSVQESNQVLPEVEHWHQTGTDFFSLLNTEPVNQTLPLLFNTQLQKLQNTLVGIPYKNKQEEVKPVEDKSLLTVNCFGEMREVEALYDYLLNQFAKKPELKSDDILVAIPDLDKYAPFIRAVFGASNEADTGSRIPYLINGNLAAAESSLINGLLEILEVPNWRFTREQVMVLGRNRLIQKRFDFTDEALDQIDNWLDDAGVRWGIDAAHKQELGLPGSDQNTWREGLDRLLLGAVLPKRVNAELPLFYDVLPVDEMEGGLTALLSQFVSFCEKLFDWRERLQQSYTLQDWQIQLQSLLDDFFVVDELEESNYMQLLDLLDELKQQAQQAEFDTDVDVQALMVLLNDNIESTAQSCRYVGMVNFTGMNNLAGIPFKNLCLLGMNYDTWPTQQREPGFDLLQNQAVKEHRSGDRNKANDERYLTLQLIMAAQESLYISYVGRNIHNGAEVPPSVLVSELLDCCAQASIIIPVLQHAMHGYSIGNFTTDSDLRSHNEKWLDVAQIIGLGDKETAPLFEQKLKVEKITHLAIDDLCSFFRNPQSSFLRSSLGIYIRDEANDWDNAEPFNLDNFADSAIRSIALTQAKAGLADTSIAMAQASGQLPHGLHGEMLQGIEQEAVNSLLEDIDTEFLQKPLQPVAVDIQIEGINITGVLRDLQPEGQLLLISDNLYQWQQIQLWLKHLLLCCVKPQGIKCVTKVISLDDVLVFNEVQDPEVLLAKWISAYCDGQSLPLPFFAKLSFIYSESLDKKGDNVKALSAAKAKWEDGFKFPGEGSKSTNAFLYRGHSPLDDEFEALAQTLISPLLEARTHS